MEKDRPKLEAFAAEFARAYAEPLAAQIAQIGRDLEPTQIPAEAQ